MTKAGLLGDGVHDDTNIIDNLLAKQADYNLWVQDMEQKFPNIRVLKNATLEI